MTNDRPLVIYHGNCADGFAAAWCFWNKFEGECDFVSGVYQQDPPDVTNRFVYLVDFSYKRDVVLKMLESAYNITLIDHHKTALEDLADIDNPKFKSFTDLNRSGAGLAWDYLYPDQIRPPLLDHVEDRDLWRFKLKGTREIQATLFSYEYDFKQWNQLMLDSYEPNCVWDMVMAGEAIERKHHKDIAELVKICKRRMVIGGNEVPVASLPYTLVSDAAHLMAQNEKFAACYWDTPESRIFGLRSSDEEGALDVSDIAKLYGGGGHAKAAGFKVPRDHELAKA